MAIIHSSRLYPTSLATPIKNNLFSTNVLIKSLMFHSIGLNLLYTLKKTYEIFIGQTLGQSPPHGFRGTG